MSAARASSARMISEWLPTADTINEVADLFLHGAADLAVEPGIIGNIDWLVAAFAP